MRNFSAGVEKLLKAFGLARRYPYTDPTLHPRLLTLVNITDKYFCTFMADQRVDVI